MKSLISCLLFLTVSIMPASAAEKAVSQSLTHDGVERSYLLFVPGAASREGRLPLVIVLHGGGGNAESAERMSGFSDLAGKEGFIVAYPNGTGRFRRAFFTWNAGHCCGYAMKNKVDDVGFIRDLIDKLVKEDRVDPKRVYVTGMSNGAMMTERLGIDLADRIAAIGPVVGGLFGDEPKPAHPVSAIIFNGANDKSIPVDGGRTGGRFPGAWDGTPLKPVAYQGEYWAAADNCALTPTEAKEGGVPVWRYRCPNGVDVARYLVPDQGHAWPGGEKGSRRGDAPSSLINATQVMWAFFKAHSK